MRARQPGGGVLGVAVLGSVMHARFFSLPVAAAVLPGGLLSAVLLHRAGPAARS
jgi:hypothetical protein